VVYDYRTSASTWCSGTTATPALADVRVRQALAMLFDRQVITDNLLEGNARPAVAYGKWGQPGYPRDLQPRVRPGGGAAAVARGRLRPRNRNPAQAAPVHRCRQRVFRRILDLASDAAAHAPGVELEVRTVEWAGLADLTKTVMPGTAC